jgi:hypothetical protein
MGLPDIKVTYVDYGFFYLLPVDQILFNPILDTFSGTTGCVLGIGGPTRVMASSDDEVHHTVFG